MPSARCSSDVGHGMVLFRDLGSDVIVWKRFHNNYRHPLRSGELELVTIAQLQPFHASGKTKHVAQDSPALF